MGATVPPGEIVDRLAAEIGDATMSFGLQYWL